MEEPEYPTLYLEDEEVDLPICHCPEKVLLAAILERTCRDLEPYAPRDARRDAIAWFNTTHKNEIFPLKFTFKQIVSELELGASCIDFLEEKVREAISYEDFIWENPGKPLKTFEEIRKSRKIRRPGRN